MELFLDSRQWTLGTYRLVLELYLKVMYILLFNLYRYLPVHLQTQCSAMELLLFGMLLIFGCGARSLPTVQFTSHEAAYVRARDNAKAFVEWHHSQNLLLIITTCNVRSSNQKNSPVTRQTNRHLRSLLLKNLAGFRPSATSPTSTAFPWSTFPQCNPELTYSHYCTPTKTIQKSICHIFRLATIT